MLIVFATMLLVIVLLLAIPVRLAFDIQHNETTHNDVTLMLLFGLIKIPLNSDFKKKQPEESVSKPDQKAMRKSKSKRSVRDKAASLFWNANFRRRLFRYLRQLFHALRINTLDIRVRLGLDDPADTGRLWGAVGPLNAMLSRIQRANICIEPEFCAEVFSFHGQGRVQVSPLRLIWISLLFFLSPPVLGALVSKS